MTGTILGLMPALPFPARKITAQAPQTVQETKMFTAQTLISTGSAQTASVPGKTPLRWLPIALCALPLALLCAPMLRRLARDLPDKPPATARGALFGSHNLALLMAYLGAGLGYILPLTFLPALAREQLPAGHPLLVGNWWWTALACLLSATLWNHAGAWLGDRRALLANYLLQLLGVVMPILLPGSIGVMACALLLARLDLVRLKVWPPSWLACIGFTSFIMFFISYGNALHLRLHAWPIIRNLLDAGVIGN